MFPALPLTLLSPLNGLANRLNDPQAVDFIVEAPGIETVSPPRRNPKRNAALTDISAKLLTKIDPVRFHPVPADSAPRCGVTATWRQRKAQAFLGYRIATS